MTDPATLLADQAAEIADSDTIPVLRAMQILELWGNALLAVLDAHKPETVKVWPDPGETEMGERTVCEDCSDDRPYVDWPCATIRAITTALEAK